MQAYLSPLYATNAGRLSAPDVLYRVQLGAFKDRANAEALAAKLKKDGYSTYITTSNK